MGIDIEAFLEEFDSSDDVKVEVKEDATKSKEIDLTFNKYVNDKFNKLQENVNEEDFNFLVRAYSEIKKFDNKLPSKLLELNKASSSVLNVLGKKYTTTFLEGIKANKNKHGTFIIENLNLISDLIIKKQIPKAIDLYNKITASYHLFPKEFIIEKIELGKKLRSIEIQINEEFTIFWAKELKQIKTKLSEEISSLKQNLVPGRIELIELNLHNINLILDNAPSIFYNELVNERIQVSRIIIISEEFLKKQYILEFEEKIQQFQYLFERFHKYQIRKDVNSALTCYDEILYLFEKMPDAFIEKKIAIYEKINKSFESLNNLLLTNSISQFMNTYSSSKILSQAREYISHAKLNLDFDSTNLISIKHELNTIPDQLSPEKLELENEIIEILDKKTVYKAKKYLGKSFKDKTLDLKELKYHQNKLTQISENNDPDRKLILNKISDIISKVENRYITQEEKIPVKEVETKKLNIEKTDSKEIPNFDELKPEKLELENEILDKKTVYEAKKYLEKSFKNKTLDLKELKDHQNKLTQISENNDPDRKLILNKISDIISKVENRYITQEEKIPVKEVKTKKLNIEKTDSKEIPTFDELKPENNNISSSSNINTQIKNTLPVSNNTQDTIPKQVINPKVILNDRTVTKPLIEVKNLGQTKLNNVNITMIDEINKNFESIQKSQDLGEKERLTKKINFYISLLPLTEIQKEQTSHKLNRG